MFLPPLFLSDSPLITSVIISKYWLSSISYGFSWLLLLLLLFVVVVRISLQIVTPILAKFYLQMENFDCKIDVIYSEKNVSWREKVTEECMGVCVCERNASTNSVWKLIGRNKKHNKISNDTNTQIVYAKILGLDKCVQVFNRCMNLMRCRFKHVCARKYCESLWKQHRQNVKEEKRQKCWI